MQDITSDTKVVKKKKHWGHYYLLSPWFLFVYSLAACIDHMKIFLQILNFTSSTTPMCRQICTSVCKLSLLLSNSYSLGTKWLLLQISRDFIFFIFKERSVYFFFPPFVCIYWDENFLGSWKCFLFWTFSSCRGVSEAYRSGPSINWNYVCFKYMYIFFR